MMQNDNYLVLIVLKLIVNFDLEASWFVLVWFFREDMCVLSFSLEFLLYSDEGLS